MTLTEDWTALNHSKDRGQLLAALTPLSHSERLRMLTRYIEQQVTWIRQQGGADTDTTANRSFLAIGFDSLMSVELLYSLQRDLSRDLDPVALEQDTIDDLAQLILAEVFAT
ncbi:acyl carrier protein [Deinococcus aquatilis]|jgi:acyl carrier protein|uniref:acyl carrier protein n=1 Tax=Deinococcus aquatilis TaxID=519440 RepID=UPI000365A37D|nr:acyl carrier protein [Deinococcus aquatilis]